MTTHPLSTLASLYRVIFLISMPFFILGLRMLDLGATIEPLGGAWLHQAFGASMPFYVNGVILPPQPHIKSGWPSPS